MELTRFDLKSQAIQERIATALERIATVLEKPEIDFTAGLVAGTLERIAKAVEKP
jgi:hypothetical protein